MMSVLTLSMSMSLLTSAIQHAIMAFMANHFNPIRGPNCSDKSDDSYGDSMYAMSDYAQQ